MLLTFASLLIKDITKDTEEQPDGEIQGTWEGGTELPSPLQAQVPSWNLQMVSYSEALWTVSFWSFMEAFFMQSWLITSPSLGDQLNLQLQSPPWRDGFPTPLILRWSFWWPASFLKLSKGPQPPLISLANKRYPAQQQKKKKRKKDKVCLCVCVLLGLRKWYLEIRYHLLNWRNTLCLSQSTGWGSSLPFPYLPRNWTYQRGTQLSLIPFLKCH